MDEAKVNAAGATPIQPMLDRIAAIKTPADVAGYLRQDFAAGGGDLFSFYSNADFHDSQLMIAYADQGGLSLPERAYYLEDGKDGSYKKIREAFVAHLSKQLQNAGIASADAEKQAADVLAFETRLAKASLSPIELRDPNNQYNFVKVADADKNRRTSNGQNSSRRRAPTSRRLLAVAAEVLRRSRQDGEGRAGRAVARLPPRAH